MEERRVKQAAEKLRRTVEGQESLDEAARKRLAGLASAASPAPQGETLEGLIRRLEQEIARLEATNPELTMSLLELVEALSAAGI
jgi:chromosome segregation ATPase